MSGKTSNQYTYDSYQDKEKEKEPNRVNSTSGLPEANTSASFQEKLVRSQLKHSPDNKKNALVSHITSIIKAKKSYLQKKLLKNPNMPLVLIRKFELSDSSTLAKFIGAEAYPYYVDGDPNSSFYEMFGFPTTYLSHLVQKKQGITCSNKWSLDLLDNVKEILELGDVNCTLTFYRGFSIWDAPPSDCERYHHISLNIIGSQQTKNTDTQS